jgi:hypothetical protein
MGRRKSIAHVNYAREFLRCDVVAYTDSRRPEVTRE